MDSRTLVMVKTQHRKACLFDKCTSILRSHNYRDIDVEIPISKDGNIIELWLLNASFSFEEYRYSLDIQCCDDNKIQENTVSIMGEVFEFIGSPVTMQNIDIGKEFPVYLEQHSFDHVFAKDISGYNTAVLVASRDYTKYELLLRREKRINQQLGSNETGVQLDFNPEEIANYKNHLQEYVSKIHKTWEYQGSYDIDLASDLSYVVIIMNQKWRISKLKIQTKPLAMQITEGSIKLILYAWLRAECVFDRFAENLRGLGFLPQNISDSNDYFEVYKKDIQYKINMSISKLADFDRMDGHVFEKFCADVLILNGFSNVSVTQGSRDQGVDIIAYKEDICYGIQCKCYSGDIGNKAVQEVYAGKNYYNCDVAVVLTNRYFTRSAIELAQKTRVRLWDRDKLSELIEKCIDQLLDKHGE